MPRETRLTIAKPDIVEAFKSQPKRVFTRAEIDEILRANRAFWRIAQRTTLSDFIDFLIAAAPLQVVELKLPYRPTKRYLWGDVSVLELTQSLRPEGYFSHFTAMSLHQLTDQIPKTIYLNFEQPASGGGGELTQQGIDLAFRRACRVSNNQTTYDDYTICVLNGRNTKQAGVISLSVPEQASVRVTSLERTLIDATVRPIYSGGVFEVLRAFGAAAPKLSVNKLVALLRNMDYTYPYHQAIGYYLEKSGPYRESQIELLRQFPIEFDFYLAHAMGKTDFNKRWRLFVPKGF